MIKVNLFQKHLTLIQLLER